ncbi:MAG: cobalamin-binding protein [Methanomicrobiales archaeon]|nr:cobalamin-binding protein [Methanomicrobiales archaeon]
MKIKKTYIISICLILTSLLVFLPVSGSDSEAGSASWPRTVEDDLHHLVLLDAKPERIVSLAPSNTEILFALGLSDQIIGVTDYCTYPDEALEKSTVGGFSTVSIEKVIALKPDFVVASPGNDMEIIDRISSLGIPAYYVEAKDLDQIYITFEKLGQLTGTEEKAISIITDLKTREEAIRAEGEKSSKKPTLAHVIWNDPIYVSGKGTFQDELIQIAGGVNVFSDKEGHAIVNVEEFVYRNPDILMINSGSGMGGDNSDILEYFKTEPRLSGLSAILSDNIIKVDSDKADRAGPRLWDLLDEIAPKIWEL